MTSSVPLAALSDSIPVIVAVIAGIVSFIGAAITVASTQRDREAKLQAERRELYARLMTAVVTNKVPRAEAGAEEHGVAVTLLFQRVRQASPTIRREIDAILSPHLPQLLEGTGADVAPLTGERIAMLQRAIDYQLTAFVRRHLPGARGRAQLPSDTDLEVTPVRP